MHLLPVEGALMDRGGTRIELAKLFVLGTLSLLRRARLGDACCPLHRPPLVPCDTAQGIPRGVPSHSRKASLEALKASLELCERRRRHERRGELLLLPRRRSILRFGRRRRLGVVRGD